MIPSIRTRTTSWIVTASITATAAACSSTHSGTGGTGNGSADEPVATSSAPRVDRADRSPVASIWSRRRPLPGAARPAPGEEAASARRWRPAPDQARRRDRRRRNRTSTRLRHLQGRRGEIGDELSGGDRQRGRSGSPGPSSNAAQEVGDRYGPDYFLRARRRRRRTLLPTVLAGGPTKSHAAEASADAARGERLPASYLAFLTTGGTGLKSGAPDTRLSNYATLPPGPFQLTKGIAYDAYAASPVHRFYQMWQQLDCDADAASWENPSGCRSDLFPWVETSIGAGSNGSGAAVAVHRRERRKSGLGFNGAGTALQGDAPYFKYLADTLAMSDNSLPVDRRGHVARTTSRSGPGDVDLVQRRRGEPSRPADAEHREPEPPARHGTTYYAQDEYRAVRTVTGADARQSRGVGPVVLNHLHAIGVDPNWRPRDTSTSSTTTTWASSATVSVSEHRKPTILPFRPCARSATSSSSETSRGCYGTSGTATSRIRTGTKPGSTSTRNICNWVQWFST